MALTALVVALSVSPAFAVDHHFGVLVTFHGFQRSGFKASLFDSRHQERVGHAHARCRNLPHHNKQRCHISIHLNGEVAGWGNIRARGVVSRRGSRDNKLNVIGGTGDFSGVGGKLLVYTGRWHFALTR
jgi:hypothetical protein